MGQYVVVNWLRESERWKWRVFCNGDTDVGRERVKVGRSGCVLRTFGGSEMR